MPPTSTSTPIDMWHFKTAVEPTDMDFLMPNGILITMKCSSDTGLAETKDMLWNEALKYPLFGHLKHKNMYRFASVTRDAKTMEYYDEKKKVFDLKLFHPFFKLIEIDDKNLEEKALNSDIFETPDIFCFAQNRSHQNYSCKRLQTSKMNVDDYLKRIDSVGYRSVSLENLKHLQANHLVNIPFENFDVIMRKKITMDIDAIYRKVVNEHRGGFCFELNQLFAWLLRTLGYNLKLIACRVCSNGQWTPFYSHLAMIVRIGQIDYIVDVGFTRGYRAPIEFICDEIQIDPIGKMKICRVDSSDCFSLLRSIDVDSNIWTPLYEFSADPKEIRDFDAMLEFVQSPDCKTIYNRSISIIHCDNCVLMLIGYQLTKLEFNSDGTQRSRSEKNLSIDEVNQAIQTLFKCKFYSPNFEPIDLKT